jgi:hypothetical protein
LRRRRRWLRRRRIEGESEKGEGGEVLKRYSATWSKYVNMYVSK